MPTIPTDGQAAYLHFEPALTALEAPYTRLLAIVPDKLARELNAEVQRINARLDAILQPYNAKAQTLLRADLDAVLGLARATTWVQARHERQILDLSDLQRHVAEATPLRDLALLHLDLLQNLKKISPSTSAAIRAGRGYADLAGDLQELGPLLKTHWPLLQPLQSLRTDPADQLTEPLIDRMAPLGTALAEADRQRRPTEGEPDWRDRLLRCHTLLDQTWDRLRGMAVGSYAFSGDLQAARTGHPSLRQLSSRD